MLQLVRLFDELPDGFDDLLAEASSEGVRNMALLAEGWANGARFQERGEERLAIVLEACAGLPALGQQGHVAHAFAGGLGHQVAKAVR